MMSGVIKNREQKSSSDFRSLSTMFLTPFFNPMTQGQLKYRLLLLLT